VKGVTAALCLLCLLSLTVLGCGSSDSSATKVSGTEMPVDAEAKSNQPPAEEAHAFTQIYRAESATLGRILFDEHGFTLYRFFKDRGSTPSCYGKCAKQWPPYLAKGEFRARKQKVLRHMGRTERRDGTVQVTYFGHPLYTYVGDKETGDTNGSGARAFGGQWYALHPSGHKAQGSNPP